MYTSELKAFIGQEDLEEHDAHYEYYRHGPLSRMVLGHQQVHGVDYAYTLQGWLKGVNSTVLSPAQDMGGDGKATIANARVGRDAYSFNLNYFTGDYGAIQTGANPFPGHTAYIGSAYKPLYNGNISSMAVNIGKLQQPQLYNYGYDQLNRIVSMDVYRGLNQDSNSWAGLNLVNDYRERIAYDANGNILKYLRNGTSSTTDMDSLNYHYYAGTNRLNHVRDQVSASNYTEDIDNQSTGNYEYDQIGNLTKDVQGRILGISWNVYGKITSIGRSPQAAGEASGIDYVYDPSGNRAGKYLNNYSAPSEHHWYVRDAQGNAMAVYQHVYTPSGGVGPLKLKEHHVYGSSRLGLVRRDVDVTNILNPKKTPVAEDLIGNTYVYTAERGWKLYELTNHLGNVLVTVTDKKNGVPSTGNSSLIDYYTADVVSASDYYPFGMLMPGRKFSSELYRYGFNGKENDNEVKGDGNQQDYGMRVYDPRLGKFLSADPIAKDYPELTPYQFASNSPIFGIDLDGLELIGNNWIFDIWLEWKFGDPTGAKTLMEGATQKAMVESRQMSYHNEKVPDQAQRRLDHANTVEATAKINKGTAEVTKFMVITSIEVNSNIVPLGEAVGAGVRAIARSRGIRNVGRAASEAKAVMKSSKAYGEVQVSAKVGEESYNVGSGGIGHGGFLELDINVKVGINNSRVVNGEAVFEVIYQAASKGYSGAINGIRGRWFGGDNLKKFNDLILNKVNKGEMTIDEAAKQTFTGRMAAKKGFTKVESISGPRNSDGTYKYVNSIIFTK